MAMLMRFSDDGPPGALPCTGTRRTLPQMRSHNGTQGG